MPDFDAVITWVDGEDQAHQQKRLAYLARERRKRQNNGTFATRFIQQGEIYYCIASILRYAPFIRTIFVVTDGQRPAFIDGFAARGLCQPDRIVVVDHRTVFAGHEDVLPTFNSLTIESMLWRIPGLGEHVVYFNDDFFLNAPAQPDQWITGEGRVRLHGRVRTVAPRLWQWRWKRWRNALKGNRYPEPSFQTAQMLSARLLGLSRYLQIPHMPYFFRRDTLAAYFESHPDVLRQQIAYRFRDLAQFAPAALANHLEMRAGCADILDTPCCAYLEPTTTATERQAAVDAVEEDRLPFGCIQSLDTYAAVEQRFFHDLLMRKFERYLPEEWIARTAGAA
jgi:hypothetical protein